MLETLDGTLRYVEWTFKYVYHQRKCGVNVFCWISQLPCDPGECHCHFLNGQMSWTVQCSQVLPCSFLEWQVLQPYQMLHKGSSRRSLLQKQDNLLHISSKSCIDIKHADQQCSKTCSMHNFLWYPCHSVWIRRVKHYLFNILGTLKLTQNYVISNYPFFSILFLKINSKS